MRTRLYVAGVLGGIGLLAGTLVVVVAFGRHNPSPPSLKDNPRPEIAGEILYTDRQACFVIAQASGAGEERLGCTVAHKPIGQQFWWIDDETVEWSYQSGPNEATIVEVDIRTGQQRETGKKTDPVPFGWQPFPTRFGELQQCLEGPDGTLACIDNDGRLVMVENDVPTTVAEFDLPKYNRPNVKGWSPDSQWVVLEYHPQRSNGPELWIISRDGSVRGTLAADTMFTQIAWRIDGVGTWPEPPE